MVRAPVFPRQLRNNLSSKNRAHPRPLAASSHPQIFLFSSSLFSTPTTPNTLNTRQLFGRCVQTPSQPPRPSLFLHRANIVFGFSRACWIERDRLIACIAVRGVVFPGFWVVDRRRACSDRETEGIPSLQLHLWHLDPEGHTSTRPIFRPWRLDPIPPSQPTTGLLWLLHLSARLRHFPTFVRGARQPIRGSSRFVGSWCTAPIGAPCLVRVP